MMSLWDALRMNMMISYQELVRTFPKATAWSVLSSIASAARKQNDGAYVSEVCQAKIADEWGMNRRTVIRQMKILVELGLIEPYGEYVIGQHARKYRMLFQVENAR
ncbi:ydjO [Escherichia coli]|uniref:helix-turn-helix domain-containing protein n=1 Tax=Escherichia coli TaxID=562 RepID=UPI0006A146CA|nr:helix-turn-helix domain-containing protein [Escherichia coli]CTU24374.1 ydjO [Escherichia coli]